MSKKQIIEDIMKSLESEKSYSQEEVQELIQKAVNSMAAPVDNSPAPESDALDKPSIQEATTPSQQAAEGNPEMAPVQDPLEMISQEATTTAPAELEVPTPVDVTNNTGAQGGHQEPIFADGLFGGEFSLGATLKQGPTGNVMTNMKPQMFDYEEKYKNSTKNQKMTSKDFESKKENK